jgi:hypothetical protein
VKQDKPFHPGMFIHKDFLPIFVFVILLHVLWDSPLLWDPLGNAALLKGKIYLWTVSFMGSWYLALLLVQAGLLQVKTAKQLPMPVSASVSQTMLDAPSTKAGPPSTRTSVAAPKAASETSAPTPNPVDPADSRHGNERFPALKPGASGR